jgi:hypothetical protein
LCPTNVGREREIVNSENYKKQIEAIDNEVNVLHPLLNDLFPEMNNVTYVEYTHGPNEKGADFVIEKNDPDLGETYYVGVVAKTDKILQNFTDVERQIDECGHSRLIRQGKQSVRLPEIWVITTKNYSHNAKDKISEKYRSCKIYFFDAEWLVKQVTKHIPYYWHQLPHSIGAYISTLSRRIGEMKVQTSLLSLSPNTEIYIELDIEEKEDDKYKKTNRGRKSRLVNIIDCIIDNKITLLEAEMGFGKSTLARKIASDFADPYELKKRNILPVFMPFKDFSDIQYNDFEECLKKIIGDDTYTETCAQKSTYLIILDGMDEANGQPNVCSRVVAKLIEGVRSRTDVRILLTSRPFNLMEELPEVASSVKTYHIRPLSTKKLILFIREVCAQLNLPTKLYEDLAKSDLFKQLPQNPIAASLLSNLLAQNKQDLPSNLTELYSKSIEFMLGRWDEKRGISTEKIFKACERLSRHLARYMLENHLIFISLAEAKEMGEKFFNERNIGISVEEIFQHLLNRSHLFGIFQDTQTIFFRHRSFAEYLYALDAHALRDMTIDSRALHPYWANTYFFYVGLLAECPEVLQQLLALPANDEGPRWIKLLHMSNYLLAGYQSPYVIVEEGLHFLIVDAAKLYLDILNGKTKTKFNSLSEMQLLCLFTALVKKSYSYEFFKKALPLAMAQIDESDIGNHEKIVSIFFLASTLGDLGDQCGFQFLLANYTIDQIPISVSIGLQCEVEFSGKNFANNHAIKAHDKRLKKLLIGSSEIEHRANKQKFDELFDAPIRTRSESKTNTVVPKEKRQIAMSK